MDGRTLASAYAQSLRFVCEMSEATIQSIAMLYFGSSISSLQALPSSIIELHIKDKITEFVDTIPQFIFDQLRLISYSLSSESVITGLGTNTAARVLPNVVNRASVDVNAYKMTDGSICYCSPTRTCTSPAAIYWDPTEQTDGVYSVSGNRTSIIGMRTDCYPFDGFLASTLECYYDPSCLQLLVSNATSFAPLNSTVRSRFTLDSKIEDLTRRLMTEETLFNYSVKGYYEQCAPLTCAYTYTYRNTLLNIVTTIVGLIGGLNTILRLSIPLLVTLAWKVKAKLLRTAAGESVVVARPQFPFTPNIAGKNIFSTRRNRMRSMTTSSR